MKDRTEDIVIRLQKYIYNNNLLYWWAYELIGDIIIAIFFDKNSMILKIKVKRK